MSHLRLSSAPLNAKDSCAVSPPLEPMSTYTEKELFNVWISFKEREREREIPSIRKKLLC